MTDPEESPARPTHPSRPAALWPGRPSFGHPPTRSLRRADLAAVLVGVATIGYTIFSLLQPLVGRDATQDVANRGAGTSQSAPANAGSAVIAPRSSTDAPAPPAIAPTSAPTTSSGLPPGTDPDGSTDEPRGVIRTDDDADRPGGGAGRATSHGRTTGDGRTTGAAPATGTGTARPARGGSGQDARDHSGGGGSDHRAADRGETSRGEDSRATPARPDGSATQTAGTAPSQLRPWQRDPRADRRQSPSGSDASTPSASADRRPGPSAPPTQQPPAPQPADRRAPPQVSVPCSRPSFLPVQVTFVNTSSVPIDLQWSTFTCGRRSYGVVPPGGRTTINTWVTHVWAFTDATTGTTLSTHVAQPGDRVVNMP